MSTEPETPFDSIEGSYQYVDMLSEAIAETRRDVEAEVALAEKENADRRKQGTPAGFLQSRQAGRPHDHQPPDSQRPEDLAAGSARGTSTPESRSARSAD